MLGIGLGKANIGDNAPVQKPLPAHGQHTAVDIRQDNLSAVAYTMSKPGHQVAGAPREVKHPLPLPDRADLHGKPFPDNCFDCVTIAFGLRNVTHKEQALADMWRVIKPGGKVLVLEFSHLTVSALKPFYDFYSFKALPLMGKLVAGDADSYRYLAESIRMHPDQDTLKSMMEAAGFERCVYFNLTAGVAALHRGWKF